MRNLGGFCPASSIERLNFLRNPSLILYHLFEVFRTAKAEVKSVSLPTSILGKPEFVFFFFFVICYICAL